MCDRLSGPISETELLAILRKNLRDEIRKDLLYVTVYNLDHLKHLCRDRERLLTEFRGKNRPMPFSGVGSRRVSEVEWEQRNEALQDEEEVEAVATDPKLVKNKNLLVCWNCKVEGHRFTECLEKPNLFCWGCGKEKVYRTNCERCRPGNSQRGAGNNNRLRPNHP